MSLPFSDLAVYISAFQKVKQKNPTGTKAEKGEGRDS
jgi:hypothetical protein